MVSMGFAFILTFKLSYPILQYPAIFQNSGKLELRKCKFLL